MKTSNKTWFYVALFSTLIAVGIHFYLAAHYYDIKLGTSTGSAVCNINAKLNCDTVSASNYSALFGSPMAMWGAITNLVLALFLLVAGFNMSSQPEKIGRYSLYLSLLSVIASIIMSVISSFILNVYCLFCIFAYVLSIVNLFAHLKWMGFPINKLVADTKDLFSEFRWVLGSLIAVPVLSLLINNMILDSKGFGRFEEFMMDSLATWKQSPAVTFTESGLSMGPATSKMTIVEFADFRCPHCKAAAPSLKAFLNAHPDAKLVFKIFPLDGNCNPSPNLQKGDGISCLLAKATYCAEKLEQKGWAMQEKIFEHQEAFRDVAGSAERVKSLATEVGITQDLQVCIDEPDTQTAIVNMAQEGLNANIRGTPSIFVNGKLLQMGQSVPMLKKVYENL